MSANTPIHGQTPISSESPTADSQPTSTERKTYEVGLLLEKLEKLTIENQRYAKENESLRKFIGELQRDFEKKLESNFKSMGEQMNMSEVMRSLTQIPNKE